MIEWVDRNVDKLISKVPANRWWEAIFVSLFVYLLANFLYSQNWYFHIKTDFIWQRGASFWEMKESMFDAQIPKDPVVIYRFILPLLHKILGIGKTGSILLTLLIDYLSLVVLYAAIRKKFELKKSLIILVLVGFSFHSTGFRFIGFTDSFSHLMTSIAMYSANPFVWIASLIVGFCNDEKTLMTIPFLYLWHVYPFGTLKTFFSKWPLILASTVATAVYCVIRVYLSNNYIHEEPDTYGRVIEHVTTTLSPWLGSWFVFFVNVFMTFRWSWIIIAFGIYRMLAKGYGMDFSALVILIIVASLASGIVADISRSLAYIYPVLPLAFYEIDIEKNRKLLYSVFLMLVVTPVFILWGIQDNGIPSLYLSPPFLYDLARMILG